MFTFFNYNIHYPTLYAFVQEISERRYYGSITSALEIQGQLTTMMAGAGAAMLLEGTIEGKLNVFGIRFDVPFEIEGWTIYEIFTIDAATYFAACLIVVLIRYTSLWDRVTEDGSPFKRLRTGLQFLLNHRHITIFGVASYSVFVVILICGFYLGPMYVSDHLIALGDVWAASEMFYASGAVLAGVIILRIFRGKEWPYWNHIPHSTLRRQYIRARPDQFGPDILPVLLVVWHHQRRYEGATGQLPVQGHTE